MGEEVVKLLAENWSTINGRRRGGRRNPKLPELVRVAGGFRAWSEAYGTEWPAMGVDGQRTTAGGTRVEEEEEGGKRRTIANMMLLVVQRDGSRADEWGRVACDCRCCDEHARVRECGDREEGESATAGCSGPGGER